MQCTWQTIARRAFSSASALPTNLNPGQHTAAQLSRAASQAVRLSLRSNNLPDAFTIVNSVRYAAFSHPSPSPPTPTPTPTESLKLKLAGLQFHSVAQGFTGDVSPRLASHTLLHGLIRAGHPDRASKLAEQMIQASIPVRAKSLDVIYHSLVSAKLHTRPPLPSRLSSELGSESSEVLSLRPNMSKDKATQYALSLLMLARQSRQRRTHTMFKTLITLCLINGEIILASLLFGLLLRDWQAREALSSNTITQPQPTPINVLSPRPVRGRMEEICTSIERILSRGSTSAEYHSALQALANLAHLLDTQLITFNDITPLILLLYNCPRGKERVWVPDQWGTPQHVEAYAYFHDVLRRLIHTLPSRKPVLDVKENMGGQPLQKLLPPLSRHSYNSLLHYALRHRHSPALAEKVIHHMTTKRQPSLEVDGVARNILARARTLMHRDTKAVEMLTRIETGITHTPPPTPPLDALLTLLDTSKIHQGAYDTYTLTTHLSHLIATGNPHLVVSAIPHLLPGLPYAHYRALVIPPTAKAKPSARVRNDRQRSKGLEHAVKLGPVVFTCLLDALQKCGRTGLAEKVWLWGRIAQRASWLPKEVKEGMQVRPWCLPVEAYTIMIKVYAAEAKKKGEVMNWGYNLLRGPKSRRRQRKQRRQPICPKPNRRALGRYMGLQTYNLMLQAPERIASATRFLQKQQRKTSTSVILQKKGQLEIPQPDARFFNAILDIVGRQPGMLARKRLKSSAYYRRQLKLARERYVFEDEMPSCAPDEALLGVVEDMKKWGFAVPLVYRKMLVGKWEGISEECEMQRQRVGRTMIPVEYTKRVLGSVNDID